MNGRVYDYNLGRFMSVDPVIQSPGNSQSINPYSYIMNNPLSGTDPSGYESQKPEIETRTKARPGSRIKSRVTVTTSKSGGTTSVHVTGTRESQESMIVGVVSSAIGSAGQTFASSSQGAVAQQKPVGGGNNKVNGFQGGGEGPEHDSANSDNNVISSTFNFEGKTLNYDRSGGPEDFGDSVDAHLTEVAKWEAGRDMLTGIIESGGKLLIEYALKPIEGKDVSGKYDSVIKYDGKTPQMMRISTSKSRVDTDPVYLVLAHELHHSWRRMTKVEGKHFWNKSTFGSNDIGVNRTGLPNAEVFAVRHTNLIREQSGLNYRRTHYDHPRTGYEIRVD